MRQHSAAHSLLAACLAVVSAVKTSQQVTVSVVSDGNLVRREGARASALATHGLQRSQTVRQGPTWPRHYWTDLRSSSHATVKAGGKVIGSLQGNIPDGVVCPTWLHSDIQDQNLKPFLNSTGVHPDGFTAELSRLCGGAGTAASTYNGSWDAQGQEPQANDVRVLQGLTEWLKNEKAAGRSKTWTWDQFAKPSNGNGMAKMVQSVMSHPTHITAVGTPRVLDFGCGSGADIVAMQGALKTAVEDTLCLDIFHISRPEVTSFFLDASRPSTYKASLDSALAGNENTVHVAVSMVAFHHIPNPQMRSDALTFLHKVLHPGGIFLMAEWDNSVLPDRWIHYDLVHILPGMLFSDDAPTDPEMLKIGTKYLSVEKWIATAEQSGLKYDAPRSKAGGLTPEEHAALPGNPDRDFTVIFGK